MSGQSWTPAPKRGVVPLHPLTFGTMLGRAFSVLRHNPKVVFGFAVVVQLAVVLLTAAIMVAVLLVTIGRLDRVSPGSPDYEPLVIGTIAINAVVGFALGLLSVAFTAILQGVVAAEVRYAALGDKATLRRLWTQMRPAFWRLFGFAMLQILFVFGIIAVAAAIILGLTLGSAGSGEAIGIGIALVVLLILGSIPLGVWLGTKLLLVPSVLVFEHATLRGALLRSWRLTRGRFWVAFGVMFLINLIMGLAAQVVSIPMSLLSSLILPILTPTGGEDVSAIIVAAVLGVLLPQVLVLVIQAIAIVVQCTGSAFVYLDCRFRYEGLDQALLAHLERRDLGWTPEQLGDPFAVDPARAVSSAPPPEQVPDYLMQQGWAAAPGYAQTPYPAQPYSQPGPAPYGRPTQYDQPPQPYARPAAQPYGWPAQPTRAAPASPPAPPPNGVTTASGAAPPPPPATTEPEPPSDSPWAPPGGRA